VTSADEEPLDDWTQPTTAVGTAYHPTDSLHCLPIREDLDLTQISSKMKTRQANQTEKEAYYLTVNTWTNMAHQLDPSIGLPSARHGHTITAIGSQLWIFGGMGFESSETSGKTRGPKKRRQLNDLYLLDVAALKDHSSQRKLEWVLPTSRGPVPPRRAGHSALAMGCQLIIFGGANGSRYLSDIHILHTPTVTWSSVQLLSSPSPSLPPRPLPWAEVISKRIKPALLPVSHHQFIVFGGGLVCDFSAPIFGAIPADCYLVSLKLCSRPTGAADEAEADSPPPATAPAKRKRSSSRIR
jgi:hypothetical protein